MRTNDYQDAIATIHEVNSIYHQISEVLARQDVTPGTRTAMIYNLNLKLGKLTEEWI